MSGALLVTGAASGIGRAAALDPASEAYDRLVLVDRDADAVSALAASLGPRAHAAAMDVADPEAWAALAASGALDGLAGAVLCAGVSDAAPLADMRFEAWRRVLAVNLDGAFLALQTALGAMVDGGGVVAIGSATGRKAAPTTAAYGASKAGLAQLVRVAALESAPRRIRINALAPGGVKTPMFSGQAWFAQLAQEQGGEDGAWASLAASVPLARFAEADEVARAAHWLLSDAAALITGATLDMDGGYGV